MSARAAWVTLRQHRLEVIIAALAAVGAIVFGVYIAIAIAGLGVSDACLESVRATQDGSSASADCFRLVQAGSGILGETYITGQGTIALSVMGVLPFLLGLLGGVPIIGGELEARTAQTAWWLNPSRNRWLLRKVAPIAILLGILTIAAASVASIVADDWARWYGGRAYLIGNEGFVVVIRAFAAFGIGLAARRAAGPDAAGLHLRAGVQHRHPIRPRPSPAGVAGQPDAARARPPGPGDGRDGRPRRQRHHRLGLDCAGWNPALDDGGSRGRDRGWRTASGSVRCPGRGSGGVARAARLPGGADGNHR